MLDGLKNLLGSKKAWAGGLVMIAATVLAAVGKMTVADWKDMATWFFGIYAAAETTNSGIAMLKGVATKDVDPIPAAPPATAKAPAVPPPLPPAP